MNLEQWKSLFEIIFWFIVAVLFGILLVNGIGRDIKFSKFQKRMENAREEMEKVGSENRKKNQDNEIDKEIHEEIMRKIRSRKPGKRS